MATIKKAPATTDVIIKDFSMQSIAVDRTPKSVFTWKQALRAAESKTNPTRKLLYDLYDDIILDPHLSSVIAKLRLAVTNTDIVFSNSDSLVHEKIELVTKTEYFEQMLNHIVDADLFGFSLIDAHTVHLTNNELLSETECQIIDRRNVKPEWKLVVSSPYESQGLPYDEEIYKDLYIPVGKSKDLGLLLKAAPFVLLKRGNIEDWATFNELFGMPIRVGKYNSSFPGEKEKLTEALEESGGKLSIILPEGSSIEFVENNATGGSNDNYENFCRFMDEQISKLILGNTLTTEVGKTGNLSTAKVHESGEIKIMNSVRRRTLRVLNSKFKRILGTVFGDVSKYNFDFHEEEAELDITQQLANDIEIHTKVGKLEPEYFAEKYNVKFAKDAFVELDSEEQILPTEQKPKSEKLQKPEQKPKEKPVPPKAREAIDNTDFEDFWQTIKGFFAKAPKSA